jgi:hypothetical protein
MLCIENLVDPLINLMDFVCVENGWVLEVHANVVAQHPVPFIEVDIAVSIRLIAQPAHCADQFSLNGCGLFLGRNQFVPKALEFGSPVL